MAQVKDNFRLTFEGVKHLIANFTAENGIAPSQQEIADYFGVSQPAICRFLHKMGNSGLVTIERRHRGVLVNAAPSELVIK
jgi:DNA-binding MurR/RpiR family transcriptional regulator